MSLGFETIGNATLVFHQDGRPVLATDPWLGGTCYFGSWALDRPLTATERDAVLGAEYIWISHGHPDHLHHPSLALLPRDRKILIPNHYHPELHDFLVEQGFSVEILRYRQWRKLSDKIRCLCLDNENQDGVLIVEAGDALVVNLNDSPLCGEERFIRSLVKTHPRDKTYLARLCAVDADMLNFIDSDGNPVAGSPELRKPGMVWATARLTERLGVGTYVSSSSQHLYVRSDSIWANPYRIMWPDIERYWNRDDIRILEPFVAVDLETGDYTRKHPSQKSDLAQVTDTTGDDDYAERLSDDDWSRIAGFFGKLELLPRHFDYLEFVVGGQRRRLWIDRSAIGRRAERLHGIAFHAPRRSLVEAVGYGFFDDLLIGNFMKTELHNATLYPHFTPIVAKLGGNAKVFTVAERQAFNRHYFRRNPRGYLSWRLEQQWRAGFDAIRTVAEYLGVKRPLKHLYRKMLGDPVIEFDEDGSRPRVGYRAPPPPTYLKLDQLSAPALLVVVDTEEGFDWSAPFSTGNINVSAMARIHRVQSIFERFGVRPTYVIDYPIARQEQAYRHLRPVVDAGRCIIGSQLHPWVNPPTVEQIDRWNSFPGNLPREVEREKLRVLTATITENLGVTPEIYKAGRYGVGPNTSAILQELGYRIDLSVHAHREYLEEGGPDFRAIRPTPYWLGGSDILEIPLTCGYYGMLGAGGHNIYNIIDTSWARKLHLPGIGARLKMLNRVTLSPESSPLAEAKRLTSHLVAGGVKVFTMAFHSSSLEPGNTPYSRSEQDVDRLLRWIEQYLGFFFHELGGAPSTPLEIRSLALRRPQLERAVPTETARVPL